MGVLITGANRHPLCRHLVHHLLLVQSAGQSRTSTALPNQ